jgi:hypothetical protein
LRNFRKDCDRADRRSCWRWKTTCRGKQNGTSSCRSWVIEKKVNNNKKISQGYLKTRPRTTTSIQKDILNKVNNNNKNYSKGYI